MKYSPQLTEEIAKAVREGSTQRDAAILGCISEQTFYQWMKHKPDFAEALEKAELECKNRNIKIIQKAAITTWQAAAWWLERRYYKEFALRNEWKIGDGVVFPFTIIRPDGKVKNVSENIGKAA